MKKLVLVATMLATSISSIAFADISLPQVKKDGGTGIYTLLERRESAKRDDFPLGAISDEQLGTILWAATGKNRSGKGYTIPLTRSKPPYIDIFVVRADGTFKYDYNEHKLVEVVKDDIRAKVGSYDFIAKVPATLIFASNYDEDLQKAPNNGLITVGSMMQNAYLAADSFDIGARYMSSVKDDMKKELKLPENQSVIGMMTLGKWED